MLLSEVNLINSPEFNVFPLVYIVWKHVVLPHDRRRRNWLLSAMSFLVVFVPQRGIIGVTLDFVFEHIFACLFQYVFFRPGLRCAKCRFSYPTHSPSEVWYFALVACICRMKPNIDKRFSSKPWQPLSTYVLRVRCHVCVSLSSTAQCTLLFTRMFVPFQIRGLRWDEYNVLTYSLVGVWSSSSWICIC